MRRRAKNVLTVEQTAEVLGIGRQTAYAECRTFLSTDGRKGIPCHRLGRLILIYRAELEAWLGFPIDWPPKCDEPAPAPPAARPATVPTRSNRSNSKRPKGRLNVEQTTLPF